MTYDFFSLMLLAAYEAYLPYMTEEEILGILQCGWVPSPWKVRTWEDMKAKAGGRIETALETALSRQK